MYIKNELGVVQKVTLEDKTEVEKYIGLLYKEVQGLGRLLDADTDNGQNPCSALRTQKQLNSIHKENSFSTGEILRGPREHRPISNQITPPICSSPTLYQGRVSEEEGRPHDTRNGNQDTKSTEEAFSPNTPFGFTIKSRARQGNPHRRRGGLCNCQTINSHIQTTPKTPFHLPCGAKD